MIRGLLGSSEDSQTSRKISERIAAVQQAEALARDFARVRAQMETGAPTDGSVWAPYGAEPWLVTTASLSRHLDGRNSSDVMKCTGLH